MFLRFMAALRSRIGTLENQFFSTLYLGSGFLFVAMLFTSGAVARGVLSTFDEGSANLLQDDTYVLARTTAYALTNTFTVKAAAMFMFVSSTIGHRARQMRPHEYVIGYLLGLVLLLVMTDATWVFMLFPLWAIVVSVRLRRTETRQELEARATTEAAVEP